MSEIIQRGIIFYYRKKKKTAIEIYRKLEDVFKQDAMNVKTIEYWMHEFKCGRTNIEDAPKSGRPIIDDIDAKILKSLEDFPFASVTYISEVCGCSIGTVYNHLTSTLGYKCYKLRWVPFFLTEQLKEKRKSGAQQLKSALISSAKKDFENLITGDQSWFFLSYEPKTKWSLSIEDVPQRVQKKIQTIKFMVTVMFSKNHLFLVNVLPEGESYNSDYFTQVVLAQTLSEYQLLTNRKKALIHLDNCRVHNSKKSKQWFDENRVQRIPHPPYSPDLAPSDYFLFGYLKDQLVNVILDGPEQLEAALTEMIREIPRDIMDNVFNSWIERCNEIIGANGDYINIH